MTTFRLKAVHHDTKKQCPNTSPELWRRKIVRTCIRLEVDREREVL